MQQHPSTLYSPKHSVQIAIMTRLCISSCTCCEKSNNKSVFHKNFDCFIPRFYCTKNYVTECETSRLRDFRFSHQCCWRLKSSGMSLWSHQYYEGTRILQNVGSYLPHIPEHLNLQICYLLLMEARSSIYVAAVLIMKYQFMYSTSQIKVHLMSCTDTVLRLMQQATTNVQPHDKWYHYCCWPSTSLIYRKSYIN
jgi:hypothetical protein